MFLQKMRIYINGVNFYINKNDKKVPNISVWILTHIDMFLLGKKISLNKGILRLIYV